ncbi:protein serine/threonine kinase protein tyrosine kinase ATP binding protein kinase [Euphorbia peplus]|nr:protein serine/threonine kinase protein tyrosine kinase ATP binding protein kinase [Euphorbia peplus]
MEYKSCFECLEQQMKSDLSDELLFCYGLSDSALPVGSSAVVQMPLYSNGDSPASASQFILECLARDHHHCLAKYVDGCMIQNADIHGSAHMSLSQVTANPSDASTSKSDRDSSLDQLEFVNPIGCQTSTCYHSNRFPCSRTTAAFTPLAHIDNCSSTIFQRLVSNFLSGCLEDHVLYSLNLLIQGKASGLDSVNFLRMIGIPTFDENSIPGCLRHPNIAPTLGYLKTSTHIYSVLPKTPHTLETILHYSPNVFNSEWHIRFLLYQLLSALACLHGLGVSHGKIHPSNLMLSNLCWSWLRICNKPNSGDGELSHSAVAERRHCSMDDCASQGLYADSKLFHSMDWHSQFDLWWKGELSNFEYLLVLNKLAGRRWGDHTFHTVMPWVIDFSIKPDENSDLGWRDLSKSKWRLAKGDEQLDFTYATSEIPHHVSDECLSELAVCSYKARRLPLSVLRLAVRSVYEPNEYPSNMPRLYQWTPDECIPEFYCDPQIFCSQHSGMTDLAVPSWSSSPEEFIKLHRDALESDKVSYQIHQWIDITFGYKMSGQDAVTAKNVMLASSEPTMPRSVGRRQLFTRPHPVRLGSARKKHDNSAYPSALYDCKSNRTESEASLFSETAYLQELEEASTFSEHAGHLSPHYCYDREKEFEDMPLSEASAAQVNDRSTSKPVEVIKNGGLASHINLNYLLEHIEDGIEVSMGYQDSLLWRQKLSYSRNSSEGFAKDIFSFGCIMGELYLRRPLFNTTSLAMYIESGVVPESMQELPPHAKLLVDACIQEEVKRRPSAKDLLESPYFPTTVKASYLFIAPLQLLATNGSRLQYAANFAKQGVLKAMGTFATEMCAPFCLPLLVNPQSDDEAEWAYILLKELIKCLTPKAVKTLVLPAIKKILQTTGYSHLKVLLLQGSFVQEIWNLVGKQAYLETIHPSVISNLYIAPHKGSAAVASVLLIGTSEELGVPITFNQTILPLIHCFGKGLCPDGIDALVRIGGLLAESFIVRQMLPLLKQVVRSCVNISNQNKPEPVQSWNSLALIDCLSTLDGIVAFLPKEVVVKELLEDKSSLYVTVLMQRNLETLVLQVAATTLMAVCQRIGPELTAEHVLPQLKEFFDELAFSQESASGSGSFSKSSRVSKNRIDGEAQIESRMDLVLLMYPYFSSLLGIEKLRQCCTTWLLLEQFLLRCHNWKWEYSGESTQNGAENTTPKRHAFMKTASEYNPAKLLLNGVGWSIPQSQGTRSAKNLIPQSQRRLDGVHQKSFGSHLAASNHSKREPWFWFPSPSDSWDGPDFVARVGSLKDELPWKIRASILYSIRAHNGALRSLAVSQDECMVFTAGTGPGFKGSIQKWEVSRLNCVSGYYGHEEAVNDICVISSSGRVASCDGTIHIWNSRTGKMLSLFAEQSVDSPHLGSPSTPKNNVDNLHTQNFNTLSSGLLNSAFDGNLYTCMQHLESLEMLVVGTGNGSLRFIDVAVGRKLHLWRGDAIESSFPSLVSAICSCGSDKAPEDGTVSSPSWIASGLSSGHCRLFDLRSGNVVASWRAHDGYVTKLAAPEDHLLVSSSLDRTLRIWDLRRNCPPEPTVFKGHSDGVSGFSVWGQDVISISKNKIGLSSLSTSAEEDGQQQIVPQKLFAADHGMKNMSVLSSINIMPFSRLFVVGTEDGYLRICC